MGFPDRLHDLRKDQGISQEKLASLVGVNRVTVLNYENGKREPDYEMLAKLAAIFGVTADYLLGLSNLRLLPAVAEARARYLATTGDPHEDAYRLELLEKYYATGRELNTDDLGNLVKIAQKMAKITREEENR